MRLLTAGWQGQVAQALTELAPRRPDVAACAVGRPALDICEVGSIERALGDIRPDIVINTAAYTDVDAAETEPDRAFALNRDGAQRLASLAARRGVPIIHLSTDYVFDGLKSAPYVETDAPAPATVYGRSKLEGEAAVRAANPHHIILRTAWVYSPFGRNFVKSIMQRAAQGIPLRVVADQYGSPTYAPDLAGIILDIAARITGAPVPDALWGSYHAAGSDGASWYDMARVIVDPRTSGTAVEPIAAADYPTRTRRPAYTVLDCRKLDNHFGLSVPPWTEGIAACLRRLNS